MLAKCRLVCVLPVLGLLSCRAEAPAARPAFDPVRGGWIAERGGVPIDSDAGAQVLARLGALGVEQVAIGHDVDMPSIRRPVLTWGEEDERLRGEIRRARAAGFRVFLMPRIESPDFFRPPYPFRADIAFERAADWGAFHDAMERMLMHYGRLAAEEGVSLFGLGLELKQSAKGFPDRWRRIAANVRRVFPGPITYSANWYDEWESLGFWDALDFIGVGAYFELRGSGSPGSATREQLAARWRPIVRRLERVSARVGKPVLFTEVGYPGYVDCAERPWEWAGKQEKGVAIDHAAQARAVGALLDVVAESDRIAGLFLWSFYTDPARVQDWEYGILGRPAEDVVRAAFRRSR